VSTSCAWRRLSLGAIGALLLRKLVKPTKLFGSGTPHQIRINEVLAAEAQPDIRASTTRVLRKADAAVRQKLRRFDSLHGIFDQLAELTALFVCNCGTQVLHFDQPLADEHDLSDLRNAGDPGV